MSTVDLKKHQTLAVEATAQCGIEIHEEQQLKSIAQRLDLKKTHVYILGGGSNTLFIEHYPGCILFQKMHYIHTVHETDNKLHICAAGGVNWHELVMHCVKNRWYGLENLALIPGCVGAAPIQNIGAYGTEVKDAILSLRAFNLLTLETRTFSAAECQFAYRHSCFKTTPYQHWLILDVTFVLSKQPNFNLSYHGLTHLHPHQTHIDEVYNTIISLRQSKLPDPKKTPNAGSFFKNPIVDNDKLKHLLKKSPKLPYHTHNKQHKISAAWLIEQCGLKGFCYQGAQVSEQHALVLINKDNASGSDLLYLAQHIIACVQKKFQITLSPEVNIVPR